MQLENKVAIIYGAGGGVGSSVARAFAHEGARVFLAGRTAATVEQLAAEIRKAGGLAEAATVDALNGTAVNEHLADVVTKAGRVDISFNSISLNQNGIQGIPLSQLPVESFLRPIEMYAKSHFLTSVAAARYMAAQGAGAILIHTPEVSRIGAALVGGMGPSWAAMEALARNLSAEFGPKGVRSLCIRTTGLPETETIDLVFSLHAKALNIGRADFQGFIENLTHTKRSTTLKQLTDAAVFAVSDAANGMTGCTINLTGGLLVDW